MAKVFLEGGGDAKDLKARCRESFSELLKKLGFSGTRMPRLVACGGRGAVYDRFKTAHDNKNADDYVAMLIDSEEPLDDVEAAWRHLRSRDGWDKPIGAEDNQVLFMTTCMETWILCDRAALRAYFRAKLQESALPALIDMEQRNREAVQDALVRATRNCSNAYAKGKRSFELLSRLDPAALPPTFPASSERGAYWMIVYNDFVPTTSLTLL